MEFTFSDPSCFKFSCKTTQEKFLRILIQVQVRYSYRTFCGVLDAFYIPFCKSTLSGSLNVVLMLTLICRWPWHAVDFPDQPIVVKVGIYINSFDSINESTMVRHCRRHTYVISFFWTQNIISRRVYRWTITSQVWSTRTSPCSALWFCRWSGGSKKCSKKWVGS